MEECTECEKVQSPGVGLKFDMEANAIFLGVFMTEGGASIGLSLEEARHLKENLDKVILESEAYNSGLNSNG